MSFIALPAQAGLEDEPGGIHLRERSPQLVELGGGTVNFQPGERRDLESLGELLADVGEVRRAAPAAPTYASRQNTSSPLMVNS